MFGTVSAGADSGGNYYYSEDPAPSDYYATTTEAPTTTKAPTTTTVAPEPTTEAPKAETPATVENVAVETPAPVVANVVADPPERLAETGFSNLSLAAIGAAAIALGLVTRRIAARR